MDSATVFSPEAHTVTAVKSKVPTLKWRVSPLCVVLLGTITAVTVRTIPISLSDGETRNGYLKNH